MTINYNPNTPTPKLPYADWQIQFQQNFTQLANAFKQNHIALDDVNTAQRGNHTYVQMPRQEANPQTGSQEFTIFSKDVDGQTDQVHFVYPGNTPIVQFTNYQIYTVAATAIQTTYFTFLPGKILVYFGTLGPVTLNNSQINLVPPVALNICSINLCLKGTIPNYTPAATFITPSPIPIPLPPPLAPIDISGPVKAIIITPPSSLKGPFSVFYTVVANI